MFAVAMFEGLQQGTNKECCQAGMGDALIQKHKTVKENQSLHAKLSKEKSKIET